MKLQTSMMIFGSVFLLSASELIQNGSFSKELESWQLPKAGSDPYTASELDRTVSADSDSRSVKLSRNDARAAAWRPYANQRNIRLKPDTEYEISCYVKGRDIAVQPRSGAFIAISVGKKTLHYGSKGVGNMTRELSTGRRSGTASIPNILTEPMRLFHLAFEVRPELRGLIPFP